MCIKKKDAFFAFFAKNAFPAAVSYASGVVCFVLLVARVRPATQFSMKR